ncbi:MAG: HIT domain-containing protein [Rhodothermales bacterium]|nr:HIT domain-containing protein [Rhodothermales bacterium]MCA0269566.1 HIT domain-containing protein [Bacteroidota bacterium]
MDRLWSPWRSRHVATFDGDDRPDGRSLFARLADDPARDVERFVLYRSAFVYVVLNAFPYTNGHLLVVPYREVADYDALTPEETDDLARTTQQAIGWLRQALRPDGFNVGMNLGAAAGAGLPDHLHQHVVPRWTGDTNFMPAVGEAKVIPEALETTFARLKAAMPA